MLITKCFPYINKSKEIVTSPEDKKEMMGRRETRHSSKKSANEEEDESGQETNISQEESDAEIHSAVLPSPECIDSKVLEGKSYADQMEEVVTVINKLCRKITEVDISLNHVADGINTRMQTTIIQCDSNSTKNQELQAELKEAKEVIQQLKDENTTLRGIVHRHSTQLKDLNEKVVHLTAKSMETNIIVSNMDGDIGVKEKCLDNVITFLKTQVEIDAELSEVYVAHQLGKWQKNAKQPRSMLFRCKYALKERIFANIRNLKEKTNATGDKFYINKQLPETLMERNRHVRQQIRQVRAKEEHYLNKDKSKIEVKNRVLYIDGQQVEKQIQQVEVHEHFRDKQEKEKQDKLRITASDQICQQNSTFTTYAIKTGQIHEVRRAYQKIKRNHPGATHIIVANNLKGANGLGYQDDGEQCAGHRLAKLLGTGYPQNTAIYVV